MARHTLGTRILLADSKASTQLPNKTFLGIMANQYHGPVREGSTVILRPNPARLPSELEAVGVRI